jgi:ACR3 family arsenite transporter
VGLYIVVPVVIAQVRRNALLREGVKHFEQVVGKLGPVSVSALLLTLVLLVGFQGGAIIDQPLPIALLAVPILIQVVLNSGLAYWLNRLMGVQHCVAGPSALATSSSLRWLLPSVSLGSIRGGAGHRR